MRPEVDRRLGWRWLLSGQDGSQVTALGFDPEEAAVLGVALREERGSAVGRTGGVVVVNTDCPALDLAALGGQVEHSSLVAMVGRPRMLSRWRGYLRGFADVRHYGLLPTPLPRLVVPLGSGGWVRASLDLHRPGRRAARAAVAATRFLARFGVAQIMFRRRLVIARRLGKVGCSDGPSPECDLDPQASGPDRDFALYLGTADPDRKTIVLPLGPGAPDRLVKVARTSMARDALSREVTNLRMLEGTPLADRVPRVLVYREAERESALHIEYRPRSNAPASRIREAASGFLADLASLDRGESALPFWLGGLDQAKLSGAAARLRGALERSARGDATLRLHRSHGDFTPWNCSWTDAGFFVFDWEESRPLQPAFFDAFSYVISPALLIDGRANPARIVRDALGFATRVAGRATLPAEAIPVHLGVWLLDRATHHPHAKLEAVMLEVASRIE